MKAFVSSIRNLETALGAPRRQLGPEERKRGVGARRSIVLKSDVKKNQTIDDSVIDYARPGVGIPPDMADVIIKKRFTRDLMAGQFLDWGDFK
jgi:sialic acid synthase SpsE